ncbi:hypothetical protein BU17DRAFT_81601 [Hysterangium stoloniferum]|nr:hypothetical protein BU17DRAFT_81601 [Hysterangium stoloniferum]
MVDSPSNANTFPTRTVAIIKPHALPHRLDIERRITEAGFEIAKERQMMFQENDRDVEDLFGVSNAISLAEGPCWVYVLERRRAVEVLKTLMGSEDPGTARLSNANSLRAVYGTSLEDNAIFGSPDTATAEHQISILFASSPPFRATDLPDSPLSDRTGSLRSISSSVLAALDQEHGEEGYVPNSPPSVSSKTTSVAGRSSRTGSSFRARPVPSTNAAPSIKPRLSRAAALRAGLVQPNVSIWHEGPRQALSKEEHDRTFSNVPGHKRSETITVASTAPPVVAPRMTRAASLRQGIKEVSPSKPRVRNVEAEQTTFEGVPGHRRRETLTVASVQPPTVAPRINRTAALRADKDKPPPSSYMFRTHSAAKTPSVASTPSISRSTSSLQLAATAASGRPSSALGPRPSSVTPSANKITRAPSVARAPSVVPAPPRRAPSTAPVVPPASIGKPSIEPRQNKSALLRAKKLEAAAKDNNGKINGRPVFV